jgi:D-serine dehydratase
MTALLRSATPHLWLNPRRLDCGSVSTQTGGISLGLSDMRAAQDRLKRFAPLLAQLFPELATTHGQIESPLTPVPHMQEALGLPPEQGRLWVKADHSLPVAGSIKARGGFHEVLEWAEKLASEHDLLPTGADYRGLAQPAARALFARHQVAVGSTGNLGMAIGVMAAALGFKASVHMSTEAKEWKKDRLRQHGVQVIEHTGDYEQAVARGRELADVDPMCHFVDDERSLSLFVGYSAAALHLRDQLLAKGVVVDAAHPLLVYIPCGVGGAPSGIAWGLHQLFGEHVYCFFAEPVQSPCFLVQMLAEPGSHPSVYDFGLTNQTQADGLAIPRASLLAAQAMHKVLAGVLTVRDETLFEHLAMLHGSEAMRIEPSAAAGFSGPPRLRGNTLACLGANHVVWTTGGLLVPQEQYLSFLQQATLSIR